MSNRSDQGFSIVELIVSMVIFMVVIGTVFGLLQTGLIDRNRANRRSDILKNARAAVHIIGRDALNAGLSYNRNGAIVPDDFLAARLGLEADDDSERDILPSVVGGNDMFVNLLNANPAVRTDLLSFTYRDTAFNATNVISLTNAAAPPGAPSTVRLQTQPNQAQGNAGQANYAASKAGIIGFSKSIAKEVGSRNIRCNAIAPGFIETDMTHILTEEQKKAYIDSIPLKRLGTGDDVANACVFLGSDMLTYVTCQVLSVCGALNT